MGAVSKNGWSLPVARAPSSAKSVLTLLATQVPEAPGKPARAKPGGPDPVFRSFVSSRRPLSPFQRGRFLQLVAERLSGITIGDGTVYMVERQCLRKKKRKKIIKGTGS